MNELQKSIFENMKNIILKDIGEEYKKEVMEGYKKYIIENYNDAFDDNNINKIVSSYTYLEKVRWEDSSAEEILMTFLKDDNLDKLGNLSEIAFNYAQNKINSLKKENTLTETIAKHYINEMIKIYNLVNEYNKEYAKSYISSGIIDFEYAAGISDNMSLRIGRLNR